MPAPGEHKTVQARILHYAQEIGWTYVPRVEAEARRGSMLTVPRRKTAPIRPPPTLATCCTPRSRLQPEIQGSGRRLVGELTHYADIAGNRDFLAYLRNQGKFFDATEGRELDLTLIDYGDLTRPRQQWRNVYEVTEEFYVHNGQYGTREDVVFLINGIPVLVIECKNASKDEAIALGVDQIRRYHDRDAGSDGAGDAFHRHRSHRLCLRRDLEHGAAEHLQLEARGGWQP